MPSPYFYSGARLTSALLEGLAKPLQYKVLTQSGAYLTTSGTTELKLPKLTLSGVTLAANAGRRFVFAGRLVGGTGGDSFEFRVRQSNDTSGTVVASWRYDVKSGNQSDATLVNVDAPGPAVNNDTFYLSLVRIAGSGTLTVQADRLTSFGVDSMLNSTYIISVP